MGKYLVLAHQTASSPELRDKLKELARENPDAEFVLLVPATPVRHLLASSEGEARAAAETAADEAKNALEQFGIKITRIAIGDEAPVVAVQDDLRENPDRYDSIIVSTLPLGISRWLGLDVPHQIRRRFDVPVIHVVAEVRTTTSAEG
jgi:nucleotide-binding universal stress UspA family protein